MAKNTAGEIKKLHLEEVVLFVINNIPQADSRTLKLFLELVNAGGSFGTISHGQILKKMHQLLKYVPDASSASLLMLMDLLDINPNCHPAIAPPQAKWLMSNSAKNGAMPVFFKTQPPV